jgi:hypothetical protein
MTCTRFPLLGTRFPTVSAHIFCPGSLVAHSEHSECLPETNAAMFSVSLIDNSSEAALGRSLAREPSLYKISIDFSDTLHPVNVL